MSLAQKNTLLASSVTKEEFARASRIVIRRTEEWIAVSENSMSRQESIDYGFFDEITLTAAEREQLWDVFLNESIRALGTD